MAPPYLITLGIRASLDNQKMWQSALKKVREQRIKMIPRNSFALLQPALRASINRNSPARLANKSSDALLEFFRKSTNEFFESEILPSDKNEQTLKFILRLGCVLLRLNRLENDPAITKIIFNTGCINPVLLKNASTLTNDNMTNISRRLRDAKRNTRGGIINPADRDLIKQILIIFSDFPPSKLGMVVELARILIKLLLQIYNVEFRKSSGTSAAQFPTELLMMFRPSSRETFEKGFLATALKQLQNTKNTLPSSQNIPKLLLNKRPRSSTGSNEQARLARALSPYVDHIKSILQFYESITTSKFENKTRNETIYDIVAAITKFETTASNNSSYRAILKESTINIAEKVSEKLSSNGSRSLQNLYLASLTNPSQKRNTTRNTPNTAPNTAPKTPNNRTF